MQLTFSNSLAALAVICAALPAPAQDAENGGKVFARCKACHQIGEAATNSVGPPLNGIIGRKAGSYPGFAYSLANKNAGLTWNEPTFQDYIKNPQSKIPGTKKLFSGVKDDKSVADLIAFLKQYGPDGKKTD
jgi:cytochrome c